MFSQYSVVVFSKVTAKTNEGSCTAVWYSGTPVLHTARHSADPDWVIGEWCLEWRWWSCRGQESLLRFPRWPDRRPVPPNEWPTAASGFSHHQVWWDHAGFPKPWNRPGIDPVWDLISSRNKRRRYIWLESSAEARILSWAGGSSWTGRASRTWEEIFILSWPGIVARSPLRYICPRM